MHWEPTQPHSLPATQLGLRGTKWKGARVSWGDSQHHRQLRRFQAGWK